MVQSTLNHIEALPTETLEHVLYKLPIHQSLTKLLLVSKRINAIVNSIHFAERHIKIQASYYALDTNFITSLRNWCKLPRVYRAIAFLRLIALQTKVPPSMIQKIAGSQYLKSIIKQHNLTMPNDRYVIGFLTACDRGHSDIIKVFLEAMEETGVLNNGETEWMNIGIKLGVSCKPVVDFFLAELRTDSKTKNIIKVLFVLTAKLSSWRTAKESFFSEVRNYSTEQVAYAFSFLGNDDEVQVRSAITKAIKDEPSDPFTLGFCLLQFEESPAPITSRVLQSVFCNARDATSIGYIGKLLGYFLENVETRTPQTWSKVFGLACSNGCVLLAQFLFEDVRIKFIPDSLCDSVRIGMKKNKELGKCLLKVDTAFRGTELHEIFLAAVESSSVDCVAQFDVNQYVEIVDDGRMLVLAACKQPRIDIVRLLLASPKVNPTLYRDEALAAALSNQFISEYIVESLLQDSRVYISLAIFKKVCKMGNSQILSTFLQHSARIIADSEYSSHKQLFDATFLSACQENNDNVVSVFLRTEYRHAVSRSVVENGMRLAMQNCFMSIVACILGVLDPITDGFHASLLKVITQHRINDAKQLLQDERVDIEILTKHAFISAAGAGQTRMVLLLLEDGRVDASFDDNWLATWASIIGSASIVEFLLKDVRVSKTCDWKVALISAQKNGCSRVIKLIEAYLRDL
ncbi:UNVERIFIED_CONTAM: hypothetical protein HDU68_003295 [Siphonaria sp. JEL0065]|nr:hypothetical protein HDU68_003295 [Siphonaria sp. JEL0065]